MIEEDELRAFKLAARHTLVLTEKQIAALVDRGELPQRDTQLVSKRERGEKRPSGPALKLLTLVEKHGISAVA